MKVLSTNVYSLSAINQSTNVKSQEILKPSATRQEVLDTSHSVDTKNLMVKHSLSDFIQYIPKNLTTIEHKKTDIVAELLKDELLIRNAKTNKSQIQEARIQNEFYGYSVDKQGYLGEVLILLRNFQVGLNYIKAP